MKFGMLNEWFCLFVCSFCIEKVTSVKEQQNTTCRKTLVVN